MPRSDALGVVRPVEIAQCAADLTDRAAGTQGLAHRDEQVRVALGGGPDGRERPLRCPGVTLRAHAYRPRELAALDLRIDPLELDLAALRLGERVHPDDHALARLDLLRVPERRLLDL